MGASTHDDLEPEVIEVASGKTVAMITPKLINKTNGDTQDVYYVPVETTKTVLLTCYRRNGAPEASFMHSVRVYCVPAD